MAGKIFINYRRGDDPGSAQALFARLEQAFSPEQLFMDVANIEPGLDFVRVLKEQIEQCDVMISVIGKNWINARDEYGARRLDNSNDFVRVELEVALEQDKRVIPVLVGHAPMPSAEQLPEGLKPLARRNAVRLAHESFRADVQALIATLQRALKEAEAARMAGVRQAAEAESTPRQFQSARRQEATRRAGSDVDAEAFTARGIPDQLHDEERRPQMRGAAVIASLGVATVVALIAIAWYLNVPPALVPSLPAPTAGPLAAIPVPAPSPAPNTAIPPSTPVPTPAPAPPVGAPAMPPAPAPSAAAPGSAIGVSLSAEQERALKRGDIFKECSDCPQMVVVPAGSFTMGSPENEPGRFKTESPQHTVTLARQFAVGRFHVTVDQFSAFVEASGYDAGSDCISGYKGQNLSWRSLGFAQTGAHPVTCLNWNDANAYLGWLRKLTGKDYRLLSEAEYEYATRAKTTPGPAPRYFFGDDEALMCRYGNGADRTAKMTIGGAPGWSVFPCADGYAFTAPVGKFLPNGFGLYDMVGNVRSWTQDCPHENYIGAPVDGTAWTSGGTNGCRAIRVERGGSWLDSPPNSLRSADRGGLADTRFRGDGAGFRVGRTLLVP
jgi:formylglycine-generating enzyme required for sulfatase activity